jgi:hypothetical protein
MPAATAVQRPGCPLQLLANHIEDDAPFLGVRVYLEFRHLADSFELCRLMHEQRGVSTVVDDESRAAAVRPDERFGRAPPVLLERFPLPREYRRPFG